MPFDSFLTSLNFSREKLFHYFPRFFLLPVLFIFSRLLILCLGSDEIAQFALFQAIYAFIITIIPSATYNFLMRELSTASLQEASKKTELLYLFFSPLTFLFILIGSLLSPIVINFALPLDKLTNPILFSF